SNRFESPETLPGGQPSRHQYQLPSRLPVLLRSTQCAACRPTGARARPAPRSPPRIPPVRSPFLSLFSLSLSFSFSFSFFPPFSFFLLSFPRTRSMAPSRARRRPPLPSALLACPIPAAHAVLPCRLDARTRPSSC